MLDPLEQMLFSGGLLSVSIGLLLQDPIARVVGIICLLQFLIMMIVRRR